MSDESKVSPGGQDVVSAQTDLERGSRQNFERAIMARLTSPEAITAKYTSYGPSDGDSYIRFTAVDDAEGTTHFMLSISAGNGEGAMNYKHLSGIWTDEVTREVGQFSITNNDGLVIAAEILEPGVFEDAMQQLEEVGQPAMIVTGNPQVFVTGKTPMTNAQMERVTNKIEGGNVSYELQEARMRHLERIKAASRFTDAPASKPSLPSASLPTARK